MKNYNCKSVPEFIRMMETTIDYLEKKNATNLGDLFTTAGKKVNAGTANYTIVAKLYHEELGMGNYQAQPWCDMMVCVWFVYAFGIDKARQLCKGFQSYVNSHMGVFRSAGLTDQKPRVGDIVFFWTASLGRYGHTGIVVGVDSNGIGFTTIEGNTSSGNNIVERNGGAVTRKHYSSLPNKVLFGHVEYEKYGISLTEIPVPDPYIEIGTGLKGIICTKYTQVEVQDGATPVGIFSGQTVRPTLKRYVDGVTQFFIQDISGHDLGWITPDHFYGWILEKDTGEWWYLEDNYTWPAEDVRLIDNYFYVFNAAGYVETDTTVTLYANEDGVVRYRK